MPCDVNTAMHHHDFNNVLSSITLYCLQNNVKYCIIGGDFNADISRVNSMNTTSLQNYVSDEGLMFCMKSANYINIDYRLSPCIIRTPFYSSNLSGGVGYLCFCV